VIRRSGVSRFVDWDPNSPEVEHVLADDVMIGDDEERKQSTSGLVLAALEATGIDVHAKPHQLERLLKGLNQGRGEGVWELLRSALEKMYEQAAAGEAVEVPPVWVRALAGEV
jgi:hypothetical protein